ncbi:MAG: helix-turn-helix domain-containing protein [Butyricicoccaceae bacterium]
MRRHFRADTAFRGSRRVLTPPADLRIEQELAQIISGLRTGDMTELDRSQRIYRILCALLFPAQAGPDRKNDAIAQAVKYIGEHLFESLSVEKVADAVSLSPSHFSRLFRSTTGFSPHEYIMLHRIDEAKALLQSTSLSVKIAFRVGYRSEVNFITAFTEKTGATPTQFRRNTL